MGRRRGVDAARGIVAAAEMVDRVNAGLDEEDGEEHDEGEGGEPPGSRQCERAQHAGAQRQGDRNREIPG